MRNHANENITESEISAVRAGRHDDARAREWGDANGGRSEKEIFRGVSSFSRRRCSVAVLVVYNSQQQLTIATRSDGAKIFPLNIYFESNCDSTEWIFWIASYFSYAKMFLLDRGETGSSSAVTFEVFAPLLSLDFNEIQSFSR